MALMILASVGTSADAQQREALSVTPHLATPVVRDFSPQASLALVPAEVGDEGNSRQLMLYRSRDFPTQPDGEGGMFKSGVGRAVADGIAAGGLVFSVTHFIDSGSAVRAGLIGGGIVLVGDLQHRDLSLHHGCGATI